MSIADQPEPNLSGPWLRANVTAAAINAVAQVIVFAINNLIGLAEAVAVTPALVVGIGIAVAIQTVVFVVLGGLTADVLTQRVPAFPRRNWIVVHAVIGAILGAGVEFNHAFPDPEPVALDDLPIFLGASIPFAMAAFAFYGAIQAIVMRQAASGLKSWIGFSALSGLPLLITLPAFAIGSQTGWPHELVVDFATLIAWILAAAILIKAVHRLQPRHRG